MTRRLEYVPILSAGGTRDFGIDLRSFLNGDTVASVTVTEVTTTALTITSPQVSTSVVTINQSEVPIGMAVLARISGHAAGNTYVTKWTWTTTLGEVDSVEVSFSVE